MTTNLLSYFDTDGLDKVFAWSVIGSTKMQTEGQFQQHWISNL